MYPNQNRDRKGADNATSLRTPFLPREAFSRFPLHPKIPPVLDYRANTFYAFMWAGVLLVFSRIP